MSETPTKSPAKLPASLRKALLDLNLGGKPEGVKLTLKELVKAAEVSERTIRYYIQEGVLPPPQGSGPASRYNLEHLTRLSLVRRFKAALLPLSRIKELFEELTAEELEQVANQFYNELAALNPVLDENPAQFAAPSPDKRGNPTSHQHSRSNPPLEVFRPPENSSRATTKASDASAVPFLTELPVPPNLDALSLIGQWNRIALAPGLELHYEIGGFQDTSEGRQRLAQLVEMARNLYN